MTWGLTGYNWGPVHNSPWMTFDQVFQPSYNAITRLTTKPLMIAETASTELGGNKATWISGIRQTLTTHMPRIRALVWFDVEKETDLEPRLLFVVAQRFSRASGLRTLLRLALGAARSPRA